MSLALKPNHWDVTKRAWSVRLMALSFVMIALETALPYLQDSIPPGIFGVLAGLSTAGAYVARLLVQTNLTEEEDSNSAQVNTE